MQQDEILRIIDRKLLLKKITLWRVISILLLVFFIFNLLYQDVTRSTGTAFIAEVKINGFIDDNSYRNKKLLELATNKKIKAVIVNIDSPGGSFVGGERLYNNLRKISEQKPVIAVLGNIATSAAYLTALGADYIVASQGTITGSVGVLLQSAELTNLADKLGIKPVIIKSSAFKAVPNFAEKINIEQQDYLQDLINQSSEIFYNLVLERRIDLAEEVKQEVKLGKIFIGKSALAMNLIDELGDIESAKLWLKKQNIKIDKVKEFNLEKKDHQIKSLLKGFFIPNIESSLKLLAI